MNKRQLRLTAAALLICAFVVTSCESKKKKSADQLPKTVTSWISSNFADHPILQSIEEKEGLSTTYNIILKGNISLEFNGDGEITDIDSNTELPTAVIPPKIADYVASTYTERTITGWSLDNRNQEVELDNGMTLKFDMQGQFLRIDD